MRTNVRVWRVVARVLVLAIAIAAVPVPVLAQEKSPPAPKPGIQASIQKAVATTPGLLERAKPARTQSSPPPKTSFFKTPAGIAVLAIIGAGAGYGLYSAKHDKLAKYPPYPTQ